MLATGDTVAKDSIRVTAYGDVDELNSVFGQLRLELRREAGYASTSFGPELDRYLGNIQQQLFNLGAELSTPDILSKPEGLAIHQRHIDALESQIDKYNNSLEPLKSFILPGGGPAATIAHLARTICRRAERKVVTLASSEAIRPEAQRYLNRLSDFLFVVSRVCAHEYDYEEVLWHPEST